MFEYISAIRRLRATFGNVEVAAANEHRVGPTEGTWETETGETICVIALIYDPPPRSRYADTDVIL